MTPRILLAAIAVSLGATAPTFAQSIPDLPRLTWPEAAPITAPVTQGCTDATQPGAPQGCPRS
ncbi:hypothetical protein EGN72_18085 [Pseudorhodobacter sp. E13]|uniref:hypothetical protein n=1 Tax=Pseudorhodobacter sp. E13 TaxID=2487931 RepID=UPI000F8E4421|nr:hypothetical protein [Pseudorhodobacter sp. E13]RUS58831.1 hypothetical protein EGN72_18085 [Pseudorhodobacter sp. E13]